MRRSAPNLTSLIHVSAERAKSNVGGVRLGVRPPPTPLASAFSPKPQRARAARAWQRPHYMSPRVGRAVRAPRRVRGSVIRIRRIAVPPAPAPCQYRRVVTQSHKPVTNIKMAKIKDAGMFRRSLTRKHLHISETVSNTGHNKVRVHWELVVGHLLNWGVEHHAILQVTDGVIRDADLEHIVWSPLGPARSRNAGHVNVVAVKARETVIDMTRHRVMTRDSTR